jgi:hypothetical protein
MLSVLHFDIIWQLWISNTFGLHFTVVCLICISELQISESYL